MTLTDELIVAAAIEGEMNFVAQALARRCGIAGEVALGRAAVGDPRKRIMTLLRMGRRAAARLAAGLLAGIGDLLGIDDPGARDRARSTR